MFFFYVKSLSVRFLLESKKKIKMFEKSSKKRSMNLKTYSATPLDRTREKSLIAAKNRTNHSYSLYASPFKGSNFFAGIPLTYSRTITEWWDMRIQDTCVRKRYRARCILFFRERKVSFISEHASEQVSISRITTRAFRRNFFADAIRRESRRRKGTDTV